VDDAFARRGYAAMAMPAPTRPGVRRRGTGPPDQIRATGTRYRRPVQHQAPDPGPRATWAFVLVVLVLGLGAIVIVAFGGIGPRTASAPTPTPTRVAPTPPRPSPTGALAVTGGGGGTATDAPDRTPAARATPGPSPIAGGAATSGALRVEFPREGEVVVSRRINVFGRAPGGSRVLRELPDGSIVAAVARPDGLWILGVDLEPGTTELRFRVESSDAGPVVVHVTYQPR